MPSYQRRKEEDIRAGRLESEIRASDMQRLNKVQAKGEKVRIFMCSNCKRIFEEKSRTCPRCDTHTMGELKPRG